MEKYQWHLQASCKNLYEAEMGVLKGGLNGDFQLLEVIDPVQAEGKVLVVGILSYEDGKKQAIQISFPTTYPYAPPNIKTILSNASGAIIKPFQPQLFNKGQQYIDGTLCLFRKDFWQKDQYNVGWALRKAQKWLTIATSEKGFGPEDKVEEVSAHLQHVGQVLLPRDFIPPENSKNGQMLLRQYKPNYYILVDNIIPHSPFSIQLGSEIFQWASFDKKMTFKELIPSMDVNGFIGILLKHFQIDIKTLMEVKNFAFFIPGDPNPWHFFKAIISSNGVNVNISFQYFISHNLNRELYLRTKDLFDVSFLETKKVTIIGLGAIGSEVARSLSRNGIGHFNLFDNQMFEVGNSIRHAADLFFVGESKVSVVQQIILRTNPNITVNQHQIDVLNDTGILEKSLSESDLCIVLTGEDSVDYFINDIIVPRFRLPFIFAGISPGGLSGSIQVIKYKETACLRCLSDIGADTLPVPKFTNTFKELPMEYGSCSTPAVPGSEIDTKEIALQVSRLALQLLAEKSTSYPNRQGDLYYWHGPAGSEEKPPFSWEIKKIQPQTNCEICNPKN
ncbi:MAG: ThiF family adenylyltransferase [Bacteroidetes bacterium]|nr:ThiF family adenylyltransferase [Bacteroidota bacterium]